MPSLTDRFRRALTRPATWWPTSRPAAVGKRRALPASPRPMLALPAPPHPQAPPEPTWPVCPWCRRRHQPSGLPVASLLSRPRAGRADHAGRREDVSALVRDSLDAYVWGQRRPLLPEEQEP